MATPKIIIYNIKDINGNVVAGPLTSESHLVTQEFKSKYMRILDLYIQSSVDKPISRDYFIETSEDLDTMPQDQWRCIIKYSEKLAALTFNEELLLNIHAEVL